MTNNYVIIGLLLIIIIALTLTKVNILSSSIPSISNDKSIAVLPFYDLSPNQDQEYFSIGVMDEIMNNLFMIGDLTLPSRTAVMRYKDSNKTIKEIGDELNVSYLLEGSVLRSNNLVRLIVRLVDVESGKSIWSQDYEESVEDVMELQIKIATEVSSSLNTQISQNLKKIIETKPTENIDALILYWKGRENRDLYFKNLDKLYLDKAIDYYNMAYEIDSVFASALVGLAEAIWEKEFVENFYKEFVIDSVKNLCNKAIELNPNIAEAYFIRAKCHREKSDFNKQHSDLEKTIRLNPNHAGAYVMVGEYLFMIEDDYGQALKNFSQALRRSKEEELGDIFKQYCFLFLDLGMFEKAEYYGKKEIEINQGGQALFWVYFHQGKFREAKNEAERFQLLYPDRERGLYHLAISSLFLEDFKTANIFFKKLIELLESNGEAHSLNRYRDRYGYLLWETGYQDQAIQQFELSIRYLKSTEVLKRSMTRDNYAYHLAATECFLGNFDESYYWLEKMNEFGWHWGYPFHIERDPMFDNLKDKSKFQAIIKKAQDEKTALRVQINEMEQNGEIDL